MTKVLLSSAYVYIGTQNIGDAHNQTNIGAYLLHTTEDSRMKGIPKPYPNLNHFK